MSTSQEGALTLCHSLRNMFELYCDVVPSYHKEKLNTMALLAGNIYIRDVKYPVVFGHYYQRRHFNSGHFMCFV